MAPEVKLLQFVTDLPGCRYEITLFWKKEQHLYMEKSILNPSGPQAIEMFRSKRSRHALDRFCSASVKKRLGRSRVWS